MKIPSRLGHLQMFLLEITCISPQEYIRTSVTGKIIIQSVDMEDPGSRSSLVVLLFHIQLGKS